MRPFFRLWVLTLAALVTATMAAEPPEVSGGQRTDGESEESTAPASAVQQSPETDSASENPRVTAPSAVRRPPLTREASATDRLELDTTVVTGNRELPKVLYIVPWKKANLGDLPGQPFNSLLDEVLMPVDRDVFRREVTYFEAVSEGADATQSTSPSQQ